MIPAPPLSAFKAGAASLKRAQLPLGQRLWRVASIRFGADTWDSRDKPLFRFSPLSNMGAIVPVIYVANAKNAALAETILRAPNPGERRQVSRHHLEDRQLVELETTRTFTLLQLHSPPAHHALGAQILDQLRGTLDYGMTQTWGQYALDTFPDCDGIEWRSRQHDAHLCRLLWQIKPNLNHSFKVRKQIDLLSKKGKLIVRRLAHDYKIVLDDDIPE